MDVITSHQNTDFDSLACLVAAKKIYPRAVVVFSGSTEKNVREFLNQHPGLLQAKRIKDIDLAAIKRLIIVDTHQAERIGQFSRIAKNEKVEVHLYDHHPTQERDLRGKVEEIKDFGATITILVQQLRKKKRKLTPLEATLFILGIYEDTGSLSFPSTRSQDVEAVAYLLKAGANLEMVAEFINRELNPKQLSILNKLMATTRNYDINGVRVVIAKATFDKYVGDLAVLTHKLRDMGNLGVIFTLVQMRDRLHLVGRSKVEAVDVGRIASFFGGGGHTSAASAMIHNSSLAETEETLLTVLRKYIPPVIRAKDIMSTPVITINFNATVEETRRKMLSHNHNGFPVLKDEKLVGLITHNEINKAIHHGLGDNKVKGYMNPDIISINPATGLNEIQRIMIEKHIKYLPVVNKGRLVGIVTYTDILKSNHTASGIRSLPPVDFEKNLHPKNVAALMENKLNSQLLRLLKKIGRIAENLRFTAYLVGGFVRDLLIGVDNLDIDIVVEGLGVSFAKELVKKLGGHYVAHKKFATAIVVLPNGFKLDIATARTEFYEFPTALPTVELSSIRYDLYRRDFTINALAVNLNPGEFGSLIDFFGSRSDIKQGIIKVLHNLSFVDDPTRIFRAVRFETRYHFKIDKQTEHFIDNALRLGVLDKITSQRIREELILLLSETEPWKGVQRIDDLDVLRRLHPKLKFNPATSSLFRQVHEVLVWFNLLYLDDKISSWLVYFMALTNRLNAVELAEFVNRIKIKKKQTTIILQLYEKLTIINKKLAGQEKIKNSKIFKTLQHIPLEIILFCMGKTKNEALKRRLSHYITDLRKVKISLSGKDLQKMGIPEGPQYSEILTKIIALRLDGKVKTKKEEIAQVKKLIEKQQS